MRAGVGALAALAVGLTAGACNAEIGDGAQDVAAEDASAPGSADGSAIDAALVPDAEVALGPFGPPALIGPLSDPAATDDDPSATDDLLELYFNSNRAGGLGSGDIWVSTRATTADPWGAPVLVAELSTDQVETTPEVLGDGLTIYFSRPGGLGGTDIFVSTRPDRQSAWSTPALVPELSSAGDDRAPAPSADHLSIFIETDRPGGLGDDDVWESTRASVADPWGDPVPINAINTSGGEGNGYLRDKDLFFNGNDPALPGGQEIKVSRRPSLQVGFQDPTLVVELNSGDSDSDPWLSPDLRTMFFASNRSGDQELYEASR